VDEEASQEAMEEEEAEEEAEEAEEVAPTSMFAGGRFEVTTDEQGHLQHSLTTREACQCESMQGLAIRNEAA
jgi:hypothetical protein